MLTEIITAVQTNMQQLPKNQDVILACDVCGNGAAWVATIQEGPQQARHSLCGSCADECVVRCPSCDALIWSADGVRIYRGSNEYCTPCAKQHPAVAADLEAASRRDVDRDDFADQVRR